MPHGLRPIIPAMQATAPRPPTSPSRWALYLDLIRWNRPAGWLLLLWPTLSALWIAADGFPGWHLLAVGAALAAVAFALVLTTNPPTVALSFAALGIAIAYPYAKRLVAMPQAVLGVAFSFGIPMAFAAVLGGPDATLAAVAAAVPWAAWALLLGNLFWVLAYDTEYAMVDRDDDLRIGIQTSAITLGRWDVAAVMGFYAAYLLSWAAIGRSLGLGGVFLIGIAVAAAQAVWHYTLIRDRSRDGCFRAFRENHWLGCAVFAGVALDLALR